jgi:uncharacterized protein YoxC
MLEALTGFYVAGMVLLLILVICWIVLPIAIIGTKPLLRQILEEQRRTNALLEGRVVGVPAKTVVIKP